VLRNSGFQQLSSADSLITFERNELERLAIAHSLRLESEFFSDAFATLGGLIWRRAEAI
jgi:hypothetical protein